MADPVVCTTSQDLTRCGALQSTPALMERRFYSYTAPFANGVDLTHQFTDLIGIAMGGGDSNKVMGFGFPDQTIVWDGTALQNTYQVLLEQQGSLIPWRSADVGNGFSGSLASGSANLWPGPESVVSFPAPVRGLW